MGNTGQRTGKGIEIGKRSRGVQRRQGTWSRDMKREKNTSQVPWVTRDREREGEQEKRTVAMFHGYGASKNRASVMLYPHHSGSLNTNTLYSFT